MTWNGLITLVATGATAALAYVFQVSMARLLTTQDFGELSSIVATLSVLAIPAAGISMAVTRSVAGRAASRGSVRAGISPYVRRVLALTAALAAALLIFGAWVAGFLQLSSFTPLVYLAVLVALTNAVALGRAVLLGLHEFGWVGISQIAEALARLGAGVAIALYGPISGAGYSGYAAGLVLALALLGSRLRHAGQHVAPADGAKRDATAVPHPKDADISWPAVVLAATFIVLVNMDLIVVKHFLPPDTAGRYAAISTLAKTLFVITNSFDVVLFPLAAAARVSGASDSAHLARALLSIGLIVVPMLVAYALFGQMLVGVLFGARYVDVAPLLLPLSMGVTLLGLATLMARYRLAIGRGVASPALLSLLVLAALAFIPFHQSLAEVVGVVVAISLASAIVTMPRARVHHGVAAS